MLKDYIVWYNCWNFLLCILKWGFFCLIGFECLIGIGIIYIEVEDVNDNVLMFDWSFIYVGYV